MNPEFSFETAGDDTSRNEEIGASNKYNLRPDKIIISDKKNTSFENDHRVPNASNFKTYSNVFRSFVGLGVLSLPYAFSKAGYGYACILFPVITLISWYGVNLLIEVATHSKFEGPELQDLVEKVLGVRGKQITVSLVVIVQYGICIASVIFCVNFLDSVFCQHGIEGLCHKKWLFTTISWGISALVVAIENLNLFAYINIISATVIVTSVFTIVYYDLMFLEGSKQTSKGQVFDFRFEGIPTFLGTSLFAMEGIGLIFPVRASMKNIDRYPSIFTKVLILVLLVCGSFGLLSFLALGTNVDEVIFHSFSSDYLFLFVVEVLYATVIFFSYTMNLHPIFHLIEGMSRFKGTFSNKWGKLKIRWGVLLLIYPLCYLQPNFIDFISFIGALFNTSLGFVLPIIVYNSYFGGKGLLNPCRRLVNLITLIVALLMAVIAVIDSLLGLLGIHDDDLLEIIFKSK